MKAGRTCNFSDNNGTRLEAYLCETKMLFAFAFTRCFCCHQASTCVLPLGGYLMFCEYFLNSEINYTVHINLAKCNSIRNNFRISWLYTPATSWGQYFSFLPLIANALPYYHPETTQDKVLWNNIVYISWFLEPSSGSRGEVLLDLQKSLQNELAKWTYKRVSRTEPVHR